MTKSIDLVQPRHNYAPKDTISKGHVYMPTSLLTAGARLMDKGIGVIFHDENLSPYTPHSEDVGINLLGSPYIPEAIELQKRLQDNNGKQNYIIGGQVVSGLTGDQIKRLFGNSTINGNNDRQLLEVLGLDGELISPQKVSLVPAYEKLSDETMREYLSKEFGFYVSQGCKFSCDFCAAVRTFRDQNTGQLTKIKESYRDQRVIKKDLEYLVERAKELGINELNIYLSNLDVFQTPKELNEFGNNIKEIKRNNPNFKIGLRGLSTAASYVKAKNDYRDVVEGIVEVGFHTVGFGVDGMTPEVWKGVHKGMNTEDTCLEAIRSAREDFNITPEVLMVFGHEGIDTERTLDMAYQFTLDMAKRYGAVPRPHISKSFIPGNNGWIDPKNADRVETLLNKPQVFQALDFTALPSSFTHSDEETRQVATEYFLKICNIPGNSTLWVKPITPEMSDQEIQEVIAFNEGKYDR